MAHPFAPAARHGQIRELFPDIFFVTGSVSLPGLLPVSFSRNMTIVRQDGALTIINSMRLSDEGLAALERLGSVQHVIRLAGFHGMDDPFYKDRYGAKVWAVKGQRYTAGFNVKAKQEYFQPDVYMDQDTELPIQAQLYRFASADPGEGLLLLSREGGIIVSGDCLQNWHRTDEFFSLPAKFIMRAFGFLRPHNIGPGWLRAAKPDIGEIQGILDLPFDHVLPAHGEEVIGGARTAYRPVITRLRHKR